MTCQLTTTFFCVEKPKKSSNCILPTTLFCCWTDKHSPNKTLARNQIPVWMVTKKVGDGDASKETVPASFLPIPTPTSALGASVSTPRTSHHRSFRRLVRCRSRTQPQAQRTGQLTSPHLTSPLPSGVAGKSAAAQKAAPLKQPRSRKAGGAPHVPPFSSDSEPWGDNSA